MAQSYSALYAHTLAEHGWQTDPAQTEAVRRFEALEARLNQAGSRERGLWASGLRLTGLARRPRAVRGLYLWGGVGRGKTFLVDLFCAHVRVPVRRSHFHHFMRDVHTRLHALTNVEDPLDRIAASIAGECRVLCFDELYVSDIGDAMILGTLFTALIAAGVTLVFTSNTPPAGLYPNGLQRARFLPAIAVLEAHTEVVAIDAGIDYRLRELKREPTWLVGTGEAAEEMLGQRLDALSGEPMRGAAEVDVDGRSIPARRQSGTSVWFEFAALCEGPRSTNDYISIAERYSVVAVSGIPVFTPGHDDPARRFIALVDEFYDRGVKLLAVAAAAPQDLYAGTLLEFPFQRTVSRLIEMQSSEYLGRPHRVDVG